MDGLPDMRTNSHLSEQERAGAPRHWDCRNARRINSGDTMGRTATRARGETIARAKRLSPVFSSPREAAKEFSAVILHLSVGELAFNTNKETAKCWKAGRAFPSGVNLMALMAEFPHVRRWVNEQIDGGAFHPESPEAIAAIVQQVIDQQRRKS